MQLQNYPTELVNKLIVNTKYKLKKPQEISSQRELRNTQKTVKRSEYGYVGVKYIQALSENVVKVFMNHGIEKNVAHTTATSLRPLYNAHREKYDKNLLRNAVYKVNCMGNNVETCRKSYVGMTGRSIKVRMSEHERDQNRGNIDNSHTALTEHSVTHTHRFDTKHPKSLCIEKRYDRRVLLESFNIFTNKESVNYRQDTDSINRTNNL